MLLDLRWILWLVLPFAQPTDLPERIHDQVSVMQIVARIVFKDYNKLLVFWIKYFKNSISVYYVLLIILITTYLHSKFTMKKVTKVAF